MLDLMVATLYRVQYYSSLSETVPVVITDYTWDDIVDEASNPLVYECPNHRLPRHGAPEGEKGHCAKHDLALHHFVDCPESRLNNNVVAIHAIVYDNDKSFDRTRELLYELGIRAVAFPSPSGLPNRGRVIVPLAHPISRDDYGDAWRELNAKLGGDGDTQTIAPSQAYFVPAKLPNAPWFCDVHDGELFAPQPSLGEASEPIRAPTDDEIDLLDYETRTKEVLRYLDTLPAEVPEGGRHKFLLGVAMKCRDYGIDPEPIVRAFNAERCNPPEGPELLERTVLNNIDRYRRDAVGCALTLVAHVRIDHAATIRRTLEILSERCARLYVYQGALHELYGNTFTSVDEDRLTTLVSKYVHLYAYVETKKERGWKRASVPTWLAKEIISTPTHELLRYFREAVGVATGPLLRSDASIATRAGYDVKTRMILTEHSDEIHNDAPPGPPDPWPFALFDQFPFDSDASRSVFYSALLTAVAIDYLSGPIPVTVIDATKQQSGKSLLAQCISLLINGTLPHSDPFYSDDRMLAVLHSRLATSPRFVLFDNVENGALLASSTLDGSLTTMSVSTRKYFTQHMLDRPYRAITLVTGNGISIGSDMRPRTLYCRLASPLARPEERDDLIVADLRAAIKEHRREIGCALIDVWRAFHACRDKPKVRRWGTFEGWTPVRQLLVWLGYADPYDSNQAVASLDIGARLHELLVDYVETHGPVSVGAMLEALRPKKIGGAPASEERQELWSLLAVEAKGKEVDHRMLGWILRRRRDAVTPDKRVLRYNDNDHGKRLWYVERLP